MEKYFYTESGLKVYTDLTNVNRYVLKNKENKYIVIHYTGNNGDTAKSNCNYFKDTLREASANYFVDNNYIYQCVDDSNGAFHCGGPRQGAGGGAYYTLCTNMNSIGIEMCSKKNIFGNYYFPKETINHAATLTKDLMKKYDIPSSHVIRHFDVTGKICPAPFVKKNGNYNGEYNDAEWFNFKELVKLADRKYDYYTTYFIGNKVIQDVAQWKKYSEPLTRALAVAFIDKLLGTTMPDGSSYIHWAQKHVMSLYNKGIITDITEWTEKIEDKLSIGHALALVDKCSGNTVSTVAVSSSHWATKHALSLKTKGVIHDIDEWVDFNEPITKGEFLYLLYNKCTK